MTTRYKYRHGQRIEVECYNPDPPKQGPASRRRERFKDTWARIPHHRGLEFAKRTGNPALAVLLALEHEIHKAKSNKVKLTNGLLDRYGISPQSKTRGLRQLVAGGVVTVEQKGFAAPIVTHLWYTAKGRLR
jgi:hypothetical protein